MIIATYQNVQVDLFCKVDMHLNIDLELMGFVAFSVTRG